MEPMLATPVEALPSGSGWRYEFKWDGVRALVEVNAGVVRIRSRRGNEVTIAYPELAGLGAGIDDALVDGEIVAFDSGRPSSVGAGKTCGCASARWPSTTASARGDK